MRSDATSSRAAPPSALQVRRQASAAVLWASQMWARVAAPAGIPILCYHDIADGGSIATVSAAAFRRQMELLKSWGCGTLPLCGLAELLAGGGRLPRRRIVLTFDDGYASFHREAAPVLADLGFTASVFLPVANVGQRPGWDTGASDGSDRLLSWEQVRELSGAGFLFYPHGLTHRRLTLLSDGELREEVWESRETLSEQTGASASVFCYPYGDCDARVREAVRAAGYEAACGTAVGVNRSVADLWDLRRMMVLQTTSMGGFRARVTGAFGYYAKLRRLLRRGAHRRPQDDG